MSCPSSSHTNVNNPRFAWRADCDSGKVVFMRALLFVLLLGLSGTALAGMPVFTLSDLATLRLSGISFFIALIALVACLVRFLWNTLRRDFPKLPLLDFRRSLAPVVLLGLCFNIAVFSRQPAESDRLGATACQKH